MKKNLLLAACLLLAGSLTIQAQVPSNVEAPPDIGLALHVDFPGVGDYDLYEYGMILEAQFRDWVLYPWGYSLALGYGQWSTDKNATSPGASLYDFTGDLEIVPFGGSLLLQAYSDESWSIILEAGVRYLALDSTIKARNRDQGGTKQYDVEIDDSILFTTAVSADYIINPSVIVSLGIGYRLDITRGDLSTELGNARENIMESFFLEGALRFPL